MAQITIDPSVIEVGVGETGGAFIYCGGCQAPAWTGETWVLTLKIKKPLIATVSPSSYLTGSFPTYSASVTGVSPGSTVLTAALSGKEAPPFSADAAVIVTGEDGDQCPLTLALEDAPQEEAKLGVLYDFRDEVLASMPTGVRYIELFYRHAAEGVELMFSYPQLLSHTRTLLERFLPTIQAVVAGREVTVTAADLADVEALLEAFAVKASPELQADLRAIQEELQEGTVLGEFGITLRD